MAGISAVARVSVIILVLDPTFQILLQYFYSCYNEYFTYLLYIVPVDMMFLAWPIIQATCNRQDTIIIEQVQTNRFVPVALTYVVFSYTLYILL